MKELLKRFVREEEGATMVEYGILVALIAAVVIVVVASIGEEVNTGFETVESELQDANAP